MLAGAPPGGPAGKPPGKAGGLQLAQLAGRIAGPVIPEAHPGEYLRHGICPVVLIRKAHQCPQQLLAQVVTVEHGKGAYQLNPSSFCFFTLFVAFCQPPWDGGLFPLGRHPAGLGSAGPTVSVACE